jgi:hypothetical protein
MDRLYRWTAGATLVVGLVFSGVRLAVSFGGDADFLLGLQDPKNWEHAVFGWALAPPNWSLLPMLLLGLVYIWWASRQADSALRRQVRAAFERGLIDNPDRVRSQPPYLRLFNRLSPDRGFLSPSDRVTEGRREFDRLFDKAMGEKDYESYLVANQVAEWLRAGVKFYYGATLKAWEETQHVDKRMDELHDAFTRLRDLKRF